MPEAKNLLQKFQLSSCTQKHHRHPAVLLVCGTPESLRGPLAAVRVCQPAALEEIVQQQVPTGCARQAPLPGGMPQLDCSATQTASLCSITLKACKQP